MTDMSTPPASAIGQSIRRREDRRFLTGAGQYTDDVVMHNQSYGVFLRSPHAHARIKSIKLDKAKAAPGVVEIFTGADLADAKVGGLPCGWLIHSKDGTPMKEPAHPVLAQGKVRHVGDQVALVVAESVSQAKDAAELIEVDYEELAAVIDTTKAAGNASAVHDDVPGNVCYDWGHGNKDAVDAAFKSAAKVTTLDIVNTNSWARTDIVTVPKDLSAVGDSVVDDQGAAAAPVLFAGERVDAVHVVGGVGSSERGPEKVAERFG